jgi:hypothetical protein
LETHKKIDAMEERGVKILPGHDMEVAHHGVYPSKK